jgi:large subunit ribosomal protein L24
MKFWSKHWKSSKKPGKQRKYVYNAPIHVRHKFLSAHLSKDLRVKYKKRSFSVRKGDEVQVMRGKFKKKTGKISRVDLNKIKVYIDGMTRKKVDGTEIQVPIHPSNLRIINLTLEDKKRINALTRVVNKEEKNVKTSEKVVSSKVLENADKSKKMGSFTKTGSS